jgi:hypothetical protein
LHEHLLSEEVDVIREVIRKNGSVFKGDAAKTLLANHYSM